METYSTKETLIWKSSGILLQVTNLDGIDMKSDIGLAGP
jgi:hypothetical protein